MYQKYSSVITASGRVLRHYHHVKIDEEFKRDGEIWLAFLENANAKTITRPFLDFDSQDTTFNARTLSFFSDASANENLGMGCFFDGEWTFAKWEPDYIRNCQPSIAYLERYALCTAIFVWQEKLQNMRFVIFCDNESVVHMVNSGVSACKNCMYLLRLLTLNNLLFNRRIFVKHVKSTFCLVLSLRNFSIQLQLIQNNSLKTCPCSFGQHLNFGCIELCENSSHHR